MKNSKKLVSKCESNELIDCYFKYFQQTYIDYSWYATNFNGNVDNISIKFIDVRNKAIEYRKYDFDSLKRFRSEYSFDKKIGGWKQMASMAYTDTSVSIRYVQSNVERICIFNRYEAKLIELEMDSFHIDTTTLFVDFEKRMFCRKINYSTLKLIDENHHIGNYDKFDDFCHLIDQGKIYHNIDSNLIFESIHKEKYSPEGLLLKDFWYSVEDSKYYSDNFGNIVKRIDREKNIYNTFYEFDQKGNWTKKITLLENEKIKDTVEVVIREFNYLK